MRNSSKIAIVVAAGLVTFGATPALAQDSYIQFNTGADYSSGSYGDPTNTDFLAIPIGVKYNTNSFYLKASISYLYVKGPSNVIPGDGGVNGGTSGAVTSRSGIGDMWLTAGYSMPVGGSTWFDFVGKAKIPTASETKFLGTGSTDFVAQGQLLHSFGNVSIAAYGGRRFNGKSNLFNLRDVWLGGGGVYVNSGKSMLGLDYDYRQGATVTSPPISEVTGSLTYKVSDTLRVQGYGYTGLANGSADIGGGLQLLLRFGL
ncbi:hypothetical protein [Tsuneonella mangrovi]|uniref:hypothetical protein n=1 Tax=Tsuneonella mangrovi TaxID=1982042 RepID=UPI001470D23A|nr:hypothetical protein [Tsuneonella mangrovi]